MTQRPIRARALEGLLAGAGGGGVAAALEAAGTSWLVGGTDRQLLLLQIVAILVAFGGAAGAFSAVGWELLGRLAPRIRRLPAHWARPVLVAALASPTCATIGYALFSGGHMRSLAVRPVLIPATTIVLLVAVAVSVRWLGAIVARAPQLSRWRLRATVLALCVGSAASYVADLTMFRRLYGYLHVVLGVATFGLAAVAAACLLASRPKPPGRVASTAVLVVCASLAILAVATFDLSQNVRAVAFDRTATLRTALLALQAVSGGEDTTPRLSRAERRAQYEREARARAAGDRYGGLPGANIVLLTSDALRADQLGSYGSKLGLSPNLDRLAATGVRFEHAYCAAPHSSFSLTSLHTGEYMQESVELGRDEPRPTIADALNEAGYTTAAFYTRGIFHTEGERLRHYDERRFGFSIADHGNRVAEALTDRGIEEIDRLVARGEPKFFLWLHYFDTHEPYKSTELGEHPFDRYRGEIKHVDREIARFLRHAKKTLGRDTIFVLSADHGEEFKEHGGHYHGSTLYEEQTRVPLIFSAPGLTMRAVQSPVGLVDLAPTLLRMVGVRPPATMRGVDLRPFLYAGDGAMPPLPAFAAVTHKKMVVRWPWKLVADLQYGTYELYNLVDDPGEQSNLYDRHRDVADELRAEIYGWLDALGRPPAVAGGGSGGPRRPLTEPSAAERALALGRLQDKRAVEPLQALVADRRARVEHRSEAARLVGDLAEGSSIEPLAGALNDRDEGLRVQAAASLARLGSNRGERILEEAIYSEEVDLRITAALALGLLGNRAAVPGLVEALGAPGLEVRQDAIRLLGTLGDPSALEALLEILPEYRTRYLVVIALGMIGDRRAYETLVDLLGYEDHTDIRAYAVQALGSLGDARAIDLLVRTFHAEPEIKYTAESLVRLGAIAKGEVGGADVARGPALAAGWGACSTPGQRVTRERVRDFLNATACATALGEDARLRIAGAPRGGAGVVTWRSHLAASGRTGTLVVQVGDRRLDPVPLADTWEEHRVPLPRLPTDPTDVVFTVRLDDGGAPIAAEIDHVLLVPGP